MIGEHHKINVLPGSEDWSSPGSEIKPVEWRGYKIGLLICSDAYTQNIAGELAQQGTNVLISPAAWGPGLYEPDGEWEQRSKETRLCLYVCNRTGNEDVLNFEGSSSAVVVDGYRRVEYAMKLAAGFPEAMSLLCCLHKVNSKTGLSHMTQACFQIWYLLVIWFRDARTE